MRQQRVREAAAWAWRGYRCLKSIIKVWLRGNLSRTVKLCQPVRQQRVHDAAAWVSRGYRCTFMLSFQLVAMQKDVRD